MNLPKKATDKLVDAVAMAAANPKTFTVPSAAELDVLRAGDFVKVCRNDERFWVELTAIEPTLLHGIVANALVNPGNAKLVMGSPLTCERRHVYTTMQR